MVVSDACVKGKDDKTGRSECCVGGAEVFL